MIIMLQTGNTVKSSLHYLGRYLPNIYLFIFWINEYWVSNEVQYVYLWATINTTYIGTNVVLKYIL